METILIVEDNKEIRDEICDIFKIENYNVVEASDGLEGYLKATNELPNIIISDIMMPVLDGYRMYNKLKKNIITRSIPVIFLSALTADEDIRKGMNIGVDDYLTKPINTDDLILATAGKLEKYSKLEEKIEDMKISITNILHHELKTPLNGIIGFSDFLKTRVYKTSRDDIKKIIDNIYVSGIRLQKFVQKYLCYSELKLKSTKISELKNLKKCQFVDTAIIINEVLDDEMCKERESDFEISISAVDLKIDEYLFKTVIQELVENAIKFSKPGDKIFITSKANNVTFNIKIKNQGKGMQSDQINLIGDFCQFQKKEFAQNGSGVGLSIVKLVADIYDGKLKIESIPNMFFSVELTFNQSFKI